MSPCCCNQSRRQKAQHPNQGVLQKLSGTQPGLNQGSRR